MSGALLRQARCPNPHVFPYTLRFGQLRLPCTACSLPRSVHPTLLHLCNKLTGHYIFILPYNHAFRCAQAQNAMKMFFRFCGAVGGMANSSVFLSLILIHKSAEKFLLLNYYLHPSAFIPHPPSLTLLPAPAAAVPGRAVREKQWCWRYSPRSPGGFANTGAGP